MRYYYQQNVFTHVASIYGKFIGTKESVYIRKDRLVPSRYLCVLGVREDWGLGRARAGSQGKGRSENRPLTPEQITTEEDLLPIDLLDCLQYPILP